MFVARISDSCTTGWLHWGHGALWLTPESIVRIGDSALTMNAAFRGVREGAVGEISRRRSQPIQFADCDPGAWVAGLAAQPRVIVVKLGEIAVADVAGGISTSRLRLRMRDGRKVKFLWMRNDAVLPLVRQAVTDPTLHREQMESGRGLWALLAA